jgi:hypothetical protein
VILEPKDFELKNMLNQYLIMCKEKLSSFNNEFIKYPNNILVCITNDKVYWDNIFALKSKSKKISTINQVSKEKFFQQVVHLFDALRDDE